MTSMKERMLAGELYHADDPELAADLARAADLMERFNATRATEAQLRADLLGELLGSVAADVQIRPPFYCDYGRYISIGAGSFLNFGVTLLDVAPITIGRNVQFGPHVQVLTPTHPVEPEPRRAELGGGEADRDRRQRLARRWGDRPGRGHHRGGHRGRGRRRGHPGPAARGGRGRQSGPRHPHGELISAAHFRAAISPLGARRGN